MNILLTVNVWFVIALCLLFLLIGGVGGLLLGGRSGSGRYRY